MSKALTALRRRATNEVGAAMVEMAIVLPLLMVLVFGIIEYGRLYNAQITLTHAAREGVRDYAIHQDPAQAESTARQAISNTMLPGPLGVTTSACNPGSPTTMNLTYPFSIRIPFLGDDLLTITAEGVMRCGG
jgi:Flp pilus assembly protein TadG